jgi:hypothetical protein
MRTDRIIATAVFHPANIAPAIRSRNAHNSSTVSYRPTPLLPNDMSDFVFVDILITFAINTVGLIEERIISCCTEILFHQHYAPTCLVLCTTVRVTLMSLPKICS